MNVGEIVAARKEGKLKKPELRPGTCEKFYDMLIEEAALVDKFNDIKFQIDDDVLMAELEEDFMRPHYKYVQRLQEIMKENGCEGWIPKGKTAKELKKLKL